MSSSGETAAAHRRQRVIGALVGSVAGDALGAPFEFGPGGRFSSRFPTPARGSATEMCGGQGWQPGEWTDDTQMALLVAASLLEYGGLNERDLWERFVAWVAAGPADVGTQTRQVLGSAGDWRTAARRHFEAGHRAAGNGSIMRTVPAALFFARAGADASAVAARQISALTHGDPAAGEGCAIYHRLITAALDGEDPLEVLPDAIAEVTAEQRPMWAGVLARDWTPARAHQPNGAVWPTLGTAVWALRQHVSFEEAMRAVIDLGGDTDTVACVAGGLLGATYGIQAIPSRWSTPLTGVVPGHEPPATDLTSLEHLALRLDGAPAEPPSPPPAGPGIDPVEVEPGLWLTDLGGAARAPEKAVVISLCRTFGRVRRFDRRQVYLTDNGSNLDVTAVLCDVLLTIDAFRAENRPVVVHCYGGASRTGLVLRGWLRHSRGMSADEATREAQRVWPHTATWTPEFDIALEQLPAHGEMGADID